MKDGERRGVEGGGERGCEREEVKKGGKGDKKGKGEEKERIKMQRN